MGERRNAGKQSSRAAMTEKNPEFEEPNEDDLNAEDEATPEEEAIDLNRPLYEVLAIDTHWYPEELAPPIDEKRLLAYINDELSGKDREEVIELLVSFRSWHQALGDLRRRGVGE